MSAASPGPAAAEAAGVGVTTPAMPAIREQPARSTTVLRMVALLSCGKRTPMVSFDAVVGRAAAPKVASRYGYGMPVSDRLAGRPQVLQSRVGNAGQATGGQHVGR